MVDIFMNQAKKIWGEAIKRRIHSIARELQKGQMEVIVVWKEHVELVKTVASQQNLVATFNEDGLHYSRVCVQRAHEEPGAPINNQ